MKKFRAEIEHSTTIEIIYDQSTDLFKYSTTCPADNSIIIVTLPAKIIEDMLSYRRDLQIEGID